MKHPFEQQGSHLACTQKEEHWEFGHRTSSSVPWPNLAHSCHSKLFHPNSNSKNRMKCRAYLMHIINELLVLSTWLELQQSWQEECFKALFWQRASNCRVLCIEQRKRLSWRVINAKKYCLTVRAICLLETEHSRLQHYVEHLPFCGFLALSLFAAFLFPDGQHIRVSLLIRSEKSMSEFNGMNLLLLFSVS